MKSMLRLSKYFHRQFLIDLVHRSEYRSAELHPSFQEPRVIVAYNPLNGFRCEGPCCGCRRIKEGHLVETEADFSVGGCGQTVQRGEIGNMGGRQGSVGLKSFQKYNYNNQNLI
jgi:hypothetical protein